MLSIDPDVMFDASCLYISETGGNLLIFSSVFPKVLVFSSLGLVSTITRSRALRLSLPWPSLLSAERRRESSVSAKHTASLHGGPYLSYLIFREIVVLVIQIVGDWLCFLETEQFLKIRKFNLGGGSCQLQKAFYWSYCCQWRITSSFISIELLELKTYKKLEQCMKLKTITSSRILVHLWCTQPYKWKMC